MNDILDRIAASIEERKGGEQPAAEDRAGLATELLS